MKNIILKNNLRVVFIPKKDRSVAGFSLFIKSGPRFETKSISGISHLLEHCTLKGSERFNTEDDFYGYVESLGADINGWTFSDAVHFPVIVPTKNIKQALEFLADCLINPAFRSESFENEKKVVFEEIKQCQNSQEESIIPWELAISLMWLNSPMSVPVMGSVESVKSLTIEDLKKFHKNTYNSKNCALVVAGDFEEESLYDVVKVFEKLPIGDDIEEVRDRVDELIVGPHLRFAQKEDQQQQEFIFSFKGPSYSDADFHVKKVVSACLSEGWGSLMFSELRRNKGWVYSVWAEDFHFSDRGSLGFGFRCSIENSSNAVLYVLELLKKVKNQSISLDLDRAKGLVLGNMKNREDNMLSILYDHGYSSLYNLNFDSGAMGEMIKNISKDDIINFCNKYITSQNMHLVCVGPSDFVQENKIKEIVLSNNI